MAIGREQPLEGVEEAFLSRIDDVPHAGRNSFYGLGFSIELRSMACQEENDHKFLF